MTHKIYTRSYLISTWDKEKIKRSFERFGRVTEIIHIPKKKIAFITFEDKGSMEKAISTPPASFVVEKAEKPRKKISIVIPRLSEEITHQDISNAFKQAIAIKIIRQKKFSHCFVEFADHQTRLEYLQKGLVVMKDREINVQLPSNDAIIKKTRENQAYLKIKNYVSKSDIINVLKAKQCKFIDVAYYTTYAFITFESPADAQKFIQNNNPSSWWKYVEVQKIAKPPTITAMKAIVNNYKNVQDKVNKEITEAMVSSQTHMSHLNAIIRGKVLALKKLVFKIAETIANNLEAAEANKIKEEMKKVSEIFEKEIPSNDETKSPERKRKTPANKLRRNELKINSEDLEKSNDHPKN
jgi:RNA recognition motif-containing protein